MRFSLAPAAARPAADAPSASAGADRSAIDLVFPSASLDSAGQIELLADTAALLTEGAIAKLLRTPADRAYFLESLCRQVKRFSTPGAGSSMATLDRMRALQSLLTTATCFFYEFPTASIYDVVPFIKAIADIPFLRNIDPLSFTSLEEERGAGATDAGGALTSEELKLQIQFRLAAVTALLACLALARAADDISHVFPSPLGAEFCQLAATLESLSNTSSLFGSVMLAWAAMLCVLHSSAPSLSDLGSSARFSASDDALDIIGSFGAVAVRSFDQNALEVLCELLESPYCASSEPYFHMQRSVSKGLLDILQVAFDLNQIGQTHHLIRLHEAVFTFSPALCKIYWEQDFANLKLQSLLVLATERLLHQDNPTFFLQALAALCGHHLHAATVTRFLAEPLVLPGTQGDISNAPAGWQYIAHLLHLTHANLGAIQPWVGPLLTMLRHCLAAPGDGPAHVAGLLDRYLQSQCLLNILVDVINVFVRGLTQHSGVGGGGGSVGVGTAGGISLAGVLTQQVDLGTRAPGLGNLSGMSVLGFGSAGGDLGGPAGRRHHYDIQDALGTLARAIECVALLLPYYPDELVWGGRLVAASTSALVPANLPGHINHKLFEKESVYGTCALAQAFADFTLAVARRAYGHPGGMAATHPTSRGPYAQVSMEFTRRLALFCVRHLFIGHANWRYQRPADRYCLAFSLLGLLAYCLTVAEPPPPPASGAAAAAGPGPGAGVSSGSANRRPANTIPLSLSGEKRLRLASSSAPAGYGPVMLQISREADVAVPGTSRAVSAATPSLAELLAQDSNHRPIMEQVVSYTMLSSLGKAAAGASSSSSSGAGASSFSAPPSFCPLAVHLLVVDAPELAPLDMLAALERHSPGVGTAATHGGFTALATVSLLPTELAPVAFRVLTLLCQRFAAMPRPVSLLASFGTQPHRLCMYIAAVFALTEAERAGIRALTQGGERLDMNAQPAPAVGPRQLAGRLQTQVAGFLSAVLDSQPALASLLLTGTGDTVPNSPLSERLSRLHSVGAGCSPAVAAAVEAAEAAVSAAAAASTATAESEVSGAYAESVAALRASPLPPVHGLSDISCIQPLAHHLVGRTITAPTRQTDSAEACLQFFERLWYSANFAPYVKCIRAYGLFWQAIEILILSRGSVLAPVDASMLAAGPESSGSPAADDADVDADAAANADADIDVDALDDESAWEECNTHLDDSFHDSDFYSSSEDETETGNTMATLRRSPPKKASTPGRRPVSAGPRAPVVPPTVPSSLRHSVSVDASDGMAEADDNAIDQLASLLETVASASDVRGPAAQALSARGACARQAALAMGIVATDLRLFPARASGALASGGMGDSDVAAIEAHRGRILAHLLDLDWTRTWLQNLLVTLVLVEKALKCRTPGGAGTEQLSTFAQALTEQIVSWAGLLETAVLGQPWLFSAAPASSSSTTPIVGLINLLIDLLEECPLLGHLQLGLLPEAWDSPLGRAHAQHRLAVDRLQQTLYFLVDRLLSPEQGDHFDRVDGRWPLAGRILHRLAGLLEVMAPVGVSGCGTGPLVPAAEDAHWLAPVASDRCPASGRAGLMSPGLVLAAEGEHGGSPVELAAPQVLACYGSVLTLFRRLLVHLSTTGDNGSGPSSGAGAGASDMAASMRAAAVRLLPGVLVALGLLLARPPVSVDRPAVTADGQPLLMSTPGCAGSQFLLLLPLLAACARGMATAGPEAWTGSVPAMAVAHAHADLLEPLLDLAAKSVAECALDFGPHHGLAVFDYLLALLSVPASVSPDSDSSPPTGASQCSAEGIPSRRVLLAPLERLLAARVLPQLSLLLPRLTDAVNERLGRLCQLVDVLGPGGSASASPASLPGVPSQDLLLSEVVADASAGTWIDALRTLVDLAAGLNGHTLTALAVGGPLGSGSGSSRAGSFTEAFEFLDQMVSFVTALLPALQQFVMPLSPMDSRAVQPGAAAESAGSVAGPGSVSHMDAPLLGVSSPGADSPRLIRSELALRRSHVAFVFAFGKMLMSLGQVFSPAALDPRLQARAAGILRNAGNLWLELCVGLPHLVHQCAVLLRLPRAALASMIVPSSATERLALRSAVAIPGGIGSDSAASTSATGGGAPRVSGPASVLPAGAPGGGAGAGAGAGAGGSRDRPESVNGSPAEGATVPDLAASANSAAARALAILSRDAQATRLSSSVVISPQLRLPGGSTGSTGPGGTLSSPAGGPATACGAASSAVGRASGRLASGSAASPGNELQSSALTETTRADVLSLLGLSVAALASVLSGAPALQGQLPPLVGDGDAGPLGLSLDRARLLVRHFAVAPTSRVDASFAVNPAAQAASLAAGIEQPSRAVASLGTFLFAARVLANLLAAGDLSSSDCWFSRRLLVNLGVAASASVPSTPLFDATPSPGAGSPPRAVAAAATAIEQLTFLGLMVVADVKSAAQRAHHQALSAALSAGAAPGGPLNRDLLLSSSSSSAGANGQHGAGASIATPGGGSSLPHLASATSLYGEPPPFSVTSALSGSGLRARGNFPLSTGGISASASLSSFGMSRSALPGGLVLPPEWVVSTVGPEAGMDLVVQLLYYSLLSSTLDDGDIPVEGIVRA
ncbi:hypothetical protein H696_02922 [Fonticula alba]|uniref:Uncharacterized protein n=1 Tax=Fonticula alba TaxID=691883 RepID=A0A058ZAX3_FONAL|nr:hypothetical protein H696_02922 [Fonticula alba]KCV70577.1 hypothetical protein H696_02922 [Fonticula alba]|eukprot:XP_009495093.1 hypothetical protein H696_02922 [Fonticula alba]